jgi:DNA-binding beta-propeller fold protein YncE
MQRSTLGKISPVGLLCVGFVGALAQAQSQQRPPQAATQNREPAQATQFPDYPKIDLAVGYKWVQGWPQKSPDAEWGAMASIAVDGTGNVWTFNRGNIPIQIYRPDGALVRMWGQGGVFRNPHQIRFDKDGNVWVADNGYHTVTKFTPEGKALMTLGIKNEPGEDDRRLNQPTDVAVTPSGDVFISDGYVNSRIVHYDKNGKFVKAWGKLGTGPGEFSLPHGIALDSQRRLYVVDRNNARVQVFEQSGKYVAEWRNIITPWAIWITPKDEIYVCGSTPSQWWEVPKDGTQMNGVPAKDQIVVKFDRDGHVKQLWAFPKGEGTGAKPGELNWVHGIAVDAKGDFYLGDIRGKRAQKFARIDAGAPPPPSSTSR